MTTAAPHTANSPERRRLRLKRMKTVRNKTISRLFVLILLPSRPPSRPPTQKRSAQVAG